MSGRHVCQFRADERMALASELYQLVQRMNSRSTTAKYCADDPPDFLREKIPRYQPNPDMVPLITHTAFSDVRPTSNPKMYDWEKEDLRSVYVNIGGRDNPYKTDWEPRRKYARQCNQGMVQSPSFGVGTMQLCCQPFGQGCKVVPYCPYPPC